MDFFENYNIIFNPFHLSPIQETINSLKCNETGIVDLHQIEDLLHSTKKFKHKERQEHFVRSEEPRVVLNAIKYILDKQGYGVEISQTQISIKRK